MEGLNGAITALPDASICELIVVVAIALCPLPLLLFWVSYEHEKTIAASYANYVTVLYTYVCVCVFVQDASE